MTSRRHVTWRLCAFAGDMVFPISSSFPNFKYFWLVFLLRLLDYVLTAFFDNFQQLDDFGAAGRGCGAALVILCPRGAG